jgi:hypothetical protein
MMLKLRAKMDKQDVVVKDWSAASSVFRDWIEKMVTGRRISSGELGTSSSWVRRSPMSRITGGYGL